MCSGQTLICKSLELIVPNWDQKSFRKGVLELVDPLDFPQEIIQTTRLGIPKERDENLMLRYIDAGYLKSCTRNPLSVSQAIPIIRLSRKESLNPDLVSQ